MTPLLLQKQIIKIWWTDHNEVPNMLPTPQIVCIIFLKMSLLGQVTFWSVLVTNEHPILVTYQTGPHTFQAQKSIQEPVFFPVSILQKLLSSFQSSCGISPTLKQNVMQAHCSCNSAVFHDTSQSQLYLHTPVHNSTLHSNHMCYSPTANSKLSRLYLLTPSSRCITSRSVHKSSDHTMFLPEYKPRIVS